MSQPISLKDAEQKVFRATINDGLWDMFLGVFLLSFILALYLSESFGDFWSSAVLLPVWLLGWFSVRLIRKQIVYPRTGTVIYGETRKKRLNKFSTVMLVINLIAFGLGLTAAFRMETLPGQIYSIFLGLVLLIGFCFSAYILNLNRLYIYGLLVGSSFLIGEWLWSQGYASHHGFPITFGITSSIMILIGLRIFIRLLKNNPPLEEGAAL